MPNQPLLDETAALVPAGWVEAYLGISRQTRLELENQGVIQAIRLTPTSQRRYNRAAIEALANPSVSDPSPQSGAPEASPTPNPVSQQAGAPDVSEGDR